MLKRFFSLHFIGSKYHRVPSETDRRIDSKPKGPRNPASDILKELPIRWNTTDGCVYIHPDGTVNQPFSKAEADGEGVALKYKLEGGTAFRNKIPRSENPYLRNAAGARSIALAEYWDLGYVEAEKRVASTLFSRLN